MKHLFNILPKLTVIAAIALSASSCNRAEYAMLPKTTSYHGTQRAVAVKPAPTATPVTPESVAPATQEAVVATEQEAVVPKAAAPAVATQQAPASKPVAPAVADKSVASTKSTAPKLNLVQKAVVQKLVKKANKLAAKTHVSKKSEAASQEDANALSRNIKLGIILLLIGILLGIFGGIIGVIGLIFVILGLVLLILGLLDEV